VSDPLDRLYQERFGETEQGGKEAIWPPIVKYLERHLVDGPVVDVACDRGYFIRNVQSGERWATDLRDLSADLPDSIKFVQGNGLELDRLLPVDYFGTVFMSNYLEHLPDSAAVIEQIRVAHRLLRRGGRLVILQPNIRYVGAAYWDFIDHKVPLTEKSLVEAATLVGLRTVAVIRRFLPYSTKSRRLPSHPALVRAYLAVPLAWRILGKQTLYVGERQE
jgi:SAM-dependent methyltransferase